MFTLTKFSDHLPESNYKQHLLRMAILRMSLTYTLVLLKQNKVCCTYNKQRGHVPLKDSVHYGVLVGIFVKRYSLL